MLASAPVPTKRKEKEKESRTHMRIRNAATTVTIFIINCFRENSNDLQTRRKDGICGRAISMTNSSPPGQSFLRAKAAANETSTPAK